MSNRLILSIVKAFSAQPVHIENIENTILCIVSRLRVAFNVLRPTCSNVRPGIMCMMMSASQWRMFPLSDLRKSGTKYENSINLFKILPCMSNLFCTFAVRLVVYAPNRFFWSSGFIALYNCLIFTFLVVKPSTWPIFLYQLFFWKSKKYMQGSIATKGNIPL